MHPRRIKDRLWSDWPNRRWSGMHIMLVHIDPQHYPLPPVWLSSGHDWEQAHWSILTLTYRGCYKHQKHVPQKSSGHNFTSLGVHGLIYANLLCFLSFIWTYIGILDCNYLSADMLVIGTDKVLQASQTREERVRRKACLSLVVPHPPVHRSHSRSCLSTLGHTAVWGANLTVFTEIWWPRMER